MFQTGDPVRVGRFVVHDELAGGGMGVVYRGHDPELDRPVALKVMHPEQRHDARARDRLLAEARNLARLRHVNVVSIYELVDLGDGGVVLVMELVSGETFADWERTTPRSWRHVVAAYGQAGRGLAAAHARGIVHRDFKPANAILEAGGVGRVLDFGLARRTSARDDDQGPGSAPPADPALTAAGETPGTLAYMAPEQLAGGTATTASDQFSFCVALYRALAHTPPFAGSDAASLLAAIRAAQIADPAPGRVFPRWLRAVVVRGLAAEPARRHPSMNALLDELERPRGWRSWRVAVAVATSIVVAAAAVALALGAARAPDRDDSDQRLAAVWNPRRAGEIRAALARIETPFAKSLDESLIARLDAHGASWRRLRRAASAAHRQGTLSADLLDRTMRCLDRRLVDLDHAAGVLATVDRDSVRHAPEVIARMPPLADCADAEALLAETPPPTTAAARAQVAAVRGRLSRAAAVERTGRSAEALALAEAARADADQLGYPPVAIEAALLCGRIRIGRDDSTGAIALLADAERRALEHQQLAAAVEAGARRIYAEAVAGHDLDRLVNQAELLEPLASSLRGDRLAYPLLLNNLGAMSMARGDRDAARRYFEAGRAVVARLVDPDLELTELTGNLALVTPDEKLRDGLSAEAWQQLDTALGPDHPATLQALHKRGTQLRDPAAARDVLTRACDGYRRFHGDLLAARVECEFRLAFVLAMLGDPAAAHRFAGIAAIAPGSTDDDVRAWADLADGFAALHGGQPRRALAAFAPIIATREVSRHWWEHRFSALAHLGSGLAARALAQPAAAHRHLERARAVCTELTGRNEEAMFHQCAARADRELAAMRGAVNAPTAPVPPP